MPLEKKIWGKYRGIYAVTKCDLLCRTAGGLGGAVSPLAGLGQSAGGGDTPGSSEKIALYSTKRRPKTGQKHLCGAFFLVS